MRDGGLSHHPMSGFASVGVTFFDGLMLSA
jgi:hypothetical protein